MTKVTTKKKLAVLGNGFLAGIIVETYNKGLLYGKKSVPVP